MLEIFTDFAVFSTFHPIVKVLLFVYTFALVYNLSEAIGRARSKA